MSDAVISFSSKESDILAPEKTNQDQEAQIGGLRPRRFDEYVGQAETVETLKIAIQAARMRKESL